MTESESEIRDLLRLTDEPVEPPAELSDSIQELMFVQLEELPSKSEIRDLLRLTDHPVEPPPEISERILDQMVAEVDDQAEAPTPEVLLETSDSPANPGDRRRWPALAAVAAAVMLIVATAQPWRTDGPEESVATSSPPAYLRACVDFQTAATVGTERWFQVIPRLDGDDPSSADYLQGLAVAIDQLATVPAAAPARSELRAAADLARLADPGTVSSELVDELDNARALLEAATGHSCLDNRTVEAASP